MMEPADGWQGSREAYLPVTREAADHSTPFVAVMALRDGSVTSDTYRERTWERPEINEAMQRIRLVIEPEWTERLEREGRLGRKS